MSHLKRAFEPYKESVKEVIRTHQATLALWIATLNGPICFIIGHYWR